MELEQSDILAWVAFDVAAAALAAGAAEDAAGAVAQRPAEPPPQPTAEQQPAEPPPQPTAEQQPVEPPPQPTAEQQQQQQQQQQQAGGGTRMVFRSSEPAVERVAVRCATMPDLVVAILRAIKDGKVGHLCWGARFACHSEAGPGAVVEFTHLPWSRCRCRAPSQGQCGRPEGGAAAAHEAKQRPTRLVVGLGPCSRPICP